MRGFKRESLLVGEIDREGENLTMFKHPNDEFSMVWEPRRLLTYLLTN